MSAYYELNEIEKMNKIGAIKEAGIFAPETENGLDYEIWIRTLNQSNDEISYLETQRQPRRSKRFKTLEAAARTLVNAGIKDFLVSYI